MMIAELNNLKLVKDVNRPQILLSIAQVPESNRVFVGSSDGKIYDADVMAEKPQFQELSGHTSYVTGLAPAGGRMVSGSYDGRLIWWDVETRQPIHEVAAHARWIRRVVASSDGKLVASVADDMVCRVWDGETGKLRCELQGHEPKTPHGFPSMLYTCAFSRDGARLATADKVGHVVIWDVNRGQQIGTVEAPTMYTWDPKQRIHSIGGVRSVAFSPDGNLLAVGGMGQVGNIDHLEGKSRVEVFDWQKKERTHEFVPEQFKGLVEKLIFHSDNAWLVGAGGDNGGFVQFFNLAENKIMRQEKAPTHVHDLTVNEKQDMLYAAAHGHLLVWQL